MSQDPDWTLLDNSLNVKVYHKHHLPVIENGNIKFSKLKPQQQISDIL